MKRFLVGIFSFVLALVAARAVRADDSVCVELQLPASDARADGLEEMQSAVVWLLDHGFILDRCGIDIAERRLIVEAESSDALQDAVEAGFVVTRDMSAPAGVPRGGGVDPAYLDPNEVEAFLNQVVADHPSISRVFSIGTTTEGRTIWAIEISDQPGVDEDEPAVLLNGLHHSREVVTPHIVTDAIDTLTDGYAANDPQIVAWVRDYKSILVPMVNPDGSARVHAGDTLHRKNARDVCFGGNIGVDLNRNYPYKWGGGSVCERGSGSSGSTCSDAYRGPSAASEPETLAMMGLAEAMGFTIAVSYHSFGRFIDYPYACNDGVPDERMPEHDAISAMMFGMRNAILAVDGVSYAVHSPVALGPVNGDDTSWYYAHQGTYAMIVETGLSFQPAFADVPGIVARNRAGWKSLYGRLGESRIDVHVSAGCEPVEADVTLLDYTYDTGELPRETRLPFGRWTYLVPANDSYVVRISKPGYASQDVMVTVGTGPVDVRVELAAGVDTLPGDMNGDCVVDGDDMGLFVDAVLLAAAAPAELRQRGDFDGDCVVASEDAAEFTAALLTGASCP